ncbi:MAG: ABC transporter ATP-binding protein, partial [Chitinophagaceae bacterium]
QTIVELNTVDNVKSLQILQRSHWANQLQPQRQQTILLKVHQQQIPQLHKDLVALDIAVLSLQPRHSLEDYFLQITSGNQHVQAYTN